MNTEAGTGLRARIASLKNGQCDLKLEQNISAEEIMESRHQKKKKRKESETELNSNENYTKRKKNKSRNRKDGRKVVEEVNLGEELYHENRSKRKKRKRQNQDASSGEMSDNEIEEEEAKSNDESVVASSTAGMQKKKKREKEENKVIQKEKEQLCEVDHVDIKKRKKKRKESFSHDRHSTQHIEPDRQELGKTLKSKKMRKSKEKRDTSEGGTNDSGFTNRVGKDLIIMESQHQKKKKRKESETELNSNEDYTKSKINKSSNCKDGRKVVEEVNLREELYHEKQRKRKKRKRKNQDAGGEMSDNENKEEEAESNDVSVVGSSTAGMKKKRKREKEKNKVIQKEKEQLYEVDHLNITKRKKKRKKSFSHDQTSTQHMEPDRQELGKTLKPKKMRKSKEKRDTSEGGINDSGFTNRVGKEPIIPVNKKRKSLRATSHTSSEAVSRKKKQDKKTTKQRENSELLLHSSWAIDKELENRLKKEGFNVLKGSWSKAEENTLRTNMENILKSHDISDARMLIFPKEIEDKDKRKEMKELILSSDFYRKLGKGIRRSLFNIYRKATRMFDEKNYLGSFSKEEKEELMRLHALHGNNWVQIGRIMGRSNLAVYHEFARLNGTRGDWSEEEKNRLREAVRSMTSSQSGAQTLLHWNEIAKIVGTRNGEQCRKEWLHCLCWKDSGKPADKWNKADDLQLIERLSQSTATQECEIEWEEVAKDWDK